MPPRVLAKTNKRLLACSLLAGGLLLSLPASAADEAPEAAGTTPSQVEIEAWLEARGLPDTRDTDDGAEAPPPPPQARGVVVEGSLGAQGYLGTLKNVTPTSPWFHLQLGYEVFDWAMLFAETDLSFASTSYANPPPQPRTFFFYGFGGGLRFTARPGDFGLYVQGSVGAMRASEDVLQAYGYADADEFNPYYGAELGVEWYQVSPHYALGVHGGVRNYDQGISRLRSSETELAWVSGVSLRYAF